MTARFFASFVQFPAIISIIAISALLTACQDKPDSNTSQSQTVAVSSESANHDDLVGCYTISHDEPAQIKINKTPDGFNMQMKEPKGRAQVWDNPEPLTVMEIDKGWQYFKVNALDLNKDDVAQIIARPDGMMALAFVKDTAKNINPRLDSRFVMYIVQGSNTVYQVPCDDKPLAN